MEKTNKTNDTSTVEKTAKNKGKFLKLIGNIVLTYIMAIALLYGGIVLSVIILDIVYFANNINLNEHPMLLTANSYIEFFGIWVAMIVFILILRMEEGYANKILGKITPKTFIELLGGFLIVGGMNFVCIAGAKMNNDIHLYFHKFDILPLIFLLVAVFIQSSAEEVICRGLIYRRMEYYCNNHIIPILANSLFFSLMHISNNGVTILALLNIFLSGVFFSLIVYYTDSIAFAFAGHTGWNYCQSIVFGLPNSGSVFPYSIMKLEASNARDSFFYNCGFGVEGTVFSVIVLAVGCIVSFILGKKGIIGKNKVTQTVAPDEENKEQLI